MPTIKSAKHHKRNFILIDLKVGIISNIDDKFGFSCLHCLKRTRGCMGHNPRRGYHEKKRGSAVLACPFE